MFLLVRVPSITVGELQELHCACGATRRAPIALSIVSCVSCGRAMAPAQVVTYAPPPSRTLVATATLASQLLGTFAFALGLIWIVALRVTDATIISIMFAGTVAVFAGGNAHRGNVIALGLCAVFDLAVATATLARLPFAEAFAQPPLARFAADTHLPLAMLGAGVIAALAAITCLAALPQARRFAAWRGEQILHAARVVRG
jgi:hypothetical protein